MGETLYWDEFIVPNTSLAEGRIEFGMLWNETVRTIHEEAIKESLITAANKSGNNQPLDIKVDKDIAPYGPMTGGEDGYSGRRIRDGWYGGANLYKQSPEKRLICLSIRIGIHK